jgi:hypothetical protein
MRRTWISLLLFCGVVVLAVSSRSDVLIGSPEMTPSSVDPNGVVREDWGTFELRLEDPANAQVAGQEYAVSPLPVVTTQ